MKARNRSIDMITKEIVDLDPSISSAMKTRREGLPGHDQFRTTVVNFGSAMGC